MATVTQIMTQAISYVKGPTTFATAEEVRIANEVQSIVSGAYRWHWLATAGTNIAVSSGTQAYTMAAGDQDKVLAIMDANLLSGSTQLPSLSVWSDPIVPLSSTTGQPIAVSMTSTTAIRLWPTPGATYTFQWRYYARPVIFTTNAESFQCPGAFDAVIKLGMAWHVLVWADDTRADGFKNDFYLELARLIELEKQLVERDRR